MVYTAGSMKVKSIQYQGAEGKPDYKQEILEDKFVIKRGDDVLMEIAPDDSTELTDQENAGVDRITITRPLDVNSTIRAHDIEVVGTIKLGDFTFTLSDDKQILVIQ